MTTKELIDNMAFLAALQALERVALQSLLSEQEAEQAKKELERKLRPTILVS